MRCWGDFGKWLLTWKNLNNAIRSSCYQMVFKCKFHVLMFCYAVDLSLFLLPSVSHFVFILMEVFAQQLYIYHLFSFMWQRPSFGQKMTWSKTKRSNANYVWEWKRFSERELPMKIQWELIDIQPHLDCKRPEPVTSYELDESTEIIYIHNIMFIVVSMKLESQ